MTKQLDINFSMMARDSGMQKAIDHADQVHDRWSDKAYQYFKHFLSVRDGLFMSEDFREFVSDTLPDPPSKRAFGAIVVRAAKEGLIKSVGFAKVKNIKAHRTPAGVWEKINPPL